MSSTIRVSAELARCVREGLHTEFGTAAEHIASLAQHLGERPFEVYQEPVRHQTEALALLEEIGGQTPYPPVPIEVDPVHIPILLRVSEGQQQSYIERLEDMPSDEQRTATERVHELLIFIRTIKTTAHATG